jgi:flagellar hook-length control protein FliK
MSIALPPVSNIPAAPAAAVAPAAEAEANSGGNPFATVLKDLDASAPSTETPVTQAPLVALSAILPAEIETAGASTEIGTSAMNGMHSDAGDIFITPSFNSRLSPPAEPAIAAGTQTETPNTPATVHNSLLAMLAAKTQTQSVDVIDAMPATDAVQLDIQLTAVAPRPAAEIEGDAESASTDETMIAAVDVAIDAAALPLLSPAVPAVQNADETTAKMAEDSSDMVALTGADQRPEPRLSLFDRLSGNSADASPKTETVEAEPAAAEPAIAVLQHDKLIKTETVAVAAPAETASADTQRTPEPPQITLRPANPAQLVDGVSVIVGRASKAMMNEFVIRIDPPELGRIDVQLKMHDDGTVQAVIASDSASTYDLLRREASTIERALADSGLKTSGDSLSFSLKQNHQDQSRGNGQNQNGQRADVANTDEPVPTAILAPLRQRYDSARVNITA